MFGLWFSLKVHGLQIGAPLVLAWFRQTSVSLSMGGKYKIKTAEDWK